MSNEAQRPSNSRTDVGIVVTAAWLCASAAYFLFGEGWESMGPNEYGDWFAGVFSPVAFLWLILGYLQQGAELRLSTKALQLQVDELSLSVKAQKSLAETAAAQLAEHKQQAQEAIRRAEALTRPVFSAYAIKQNDTPVDSVWEFVIRNTGRKALAVVAVVQWDDLAEYQRSVAGLQQHEKLQFWTATETGGAFTAYLRITCRDEQGVAHAWVLTPGSDRSARDYVQFNETYQL